MPVIDMELQQPLHIIWKIQSIETVSLWCYYNMYAWSCKTHTKSTRKLYYSVFVSLFTQVKQHLKIPGSLLIIFVAEEDRLSDMLNNYNLRYLSLLQYYVLTKKQQTYIFNAHTCYIHCYCLSLTL